MKSLRQWGLRVAGTVLAVVFCSIVPKQEASAGVKQMSDGNLFDASYYAGTYSDVFTAYGMNESMLYWHYKTYGIKEGRRPYAGATVATGTTNTGVITMGDGGLFDPSYYAKNNPDVVAAFGTSADALYLHYMKFGICEGRKPYADATVSKVKLSFEVGGVYASVYGDLDVVSAIRQAGKYKVTKLTMTTSWSGELSTDRICDLIRAQQDYLKTNYGAKLGTMTPGLYGSADNYTLQVIVSLTY